jgi:hypothetical protein
MRLLVPPVEIAVPSATMLQVTVTGKPGGAAVASVAVVVQRPFEKNAPASFAMASQARRLSAQQPTLTILRRRLASGNLRGGGDTAPLYQANLAWAMIGELAVLERTAAWKVA